MLGVDTNVLVRFLAEDDPVQTPIAVTLLTGKNHLPFFVSTLVLSEAFTVLTRVMKFPRPQVIETFWRLADSDAFAFEDVGLLRTALTDAEAAGCGLTDALIARQNQAAGCSTTVTFDHRATRLDAMSPAETFI